MIFPQGADGYDDKDVDDDDTQIDHVSCTSPAKKTEIIWGIFLRTDHQPVAVWHDFPGEKKRV